MPVLFSHVWSTLRINALSLMLDPSSACQLNCVFCRCHSKLPVLSGRYRQPMRPKAVMKPGLFLKIIGELAPYLFDVWLFNWGEALLNPHLIHFIKLLKHCGVETVRLDSNLSLKISDDAVRAVIESGLDILTVSLDGLTQESYAKYRVGGDLELVMSNFERCCAVPGEAEDFGHLDGKTFTDVWNNEKV